MHMKKLFLFLVCIFLIGCEKEEVFHTNYLTVETTELQPDAYLYGIGTLGEKIKCTNYKIIEDSSNVFVCNNYAMAEKILEKHGQTNAVVWSVPVSDSSWKEALEYSRTLSLTNCVKVSFVKIEK